MKHLLGISVPRAENGIHVGKSLGITFRVLKREKADSKRVPAAAFTGLTHGSSFSAWVRC